MIHALNHHSNYPRFPERSAAQSSLEQAAILPTRCCFPERSAAQSKDGQQVCKGKLV